MTTSRDITCVHTLLEAIEAAIQSATPATRQALAETIDAYESDFPDDYYWATGVQSPRLLYDLFMTIDSACRTKVASKVKFEVVGNAGQQ
jgi:hypothetical protein